MTLDRLPAAVWLLLSLAAIATAPSAAASDLSEVLVPEGEPYETIRPLLDKIGQKSVVWSVAFSPDGSTLASGSSDNTVRLWDLASGRERARLESQNAPVRCVAFSPDGRTLVSGMSDNTVRLWDLGSGREYTRIEEPSQSVASVAFSPDGRTLAIGMSHNTVRLWDLASGRERAQFKGEGHGKAVLSVAFSPDGRMLATGSGDKTVRLWDVASGRELTHLDGHGGSVQSVAFSADGRTLASGSTDGTVRLWDMAIWRERRRLEGHSDLVLSIAFSPDGRTLASGSRDNTIRLWDVVSGRERARFESHDNAVVSVAFSPDGRTLASGSGDNTVRLWTVASGRERARLESYGPAVLEVAFSPDGRTLASGSRDHSVRIWDVASGRERAHLEGHGNAVLSVAFSPDGRTLASGSSDKTVRLWDVASGRDRASLEGHSDSVWSVAFSPDGRTLATGSFDKKVQLWDVASGRAQERLEGHSFAVLSVAFSPDGRTLASGSNDGTVRLWDVASGRERTLLEGHGSWVMSVAFSPDGRTLATGSHDTTVRLWDVATGSERAQFEGDGGPILSVAFSPDGRTLASGSWGDNLVRLWDVARGREFARLEGHGDAIQSVGWSRDGRMLASGSEDSTIRLWDVAKRTEGVPTDHKAAVQADGEAILVLGNRTTWASCVAAQPKCFRRDDGTLIAAVDAAGELTPLLPPGEAQPLMVAIARPSAESSPETEAIVTDPAEVLPLVVRVQNRGEGRAFWVNVVPAPGQSSADWALEPGAALPFVERDGQVALSARIHLLARPANPAVFDTTIRLAVAQGYGDPIPLEPVTVKVVPPMLQLEKVFLIQSVGQQAIAVTLRNTRRAIGPLAFRLYVPGLARQPAELTRERIKPSEEIILSFGIGPEEKLPSDLEVTLSALTVNGAVSGLPILDWEFNFKQIPVRSAAPWGLIAGALALLFSVAAGIRYQRTYLNPAVVRLTSSPAALREVELGDLGSTTRALKRASRLDSVLRAASVDRSWLDSATSLGSEAGDDASLSIVARRLGLAIEPAPTAAGLPSLALPPEFPLNLLRLRLRVLTGSEVARDVFNDHGRVGEVTLVLGATAAQRRELSSLAKQQPGMLVAPDGAELTRLMLAENPIDELARLIARYVPVTQISPYQTGGGVQRQGLFFGRSGVIAQVMGRDPANYLIVGGRQVGKSSLLKEVQRRYDDHPQIDCRYLVLSGDHGVAVMTRALGLPEQAGIAELLDEFRIRGRRRTLFLIDEADVFIEGERQRGYETLQVLRALSEEGFAHFILAGFWSLYRQAALDYQSPLKNFGSVLTLGALEREACKALACEPMERLGVGWESDALVERLIEQTGQRANLVSIACDEVLYALGPSERTISAANLEAVLGGNRIRDALLGWADLSASKEESRMDRIVVYASIDQESFTLADLLTTLEAAGYAADPESIKNSLARLELAFVFGRRGNEYAYQVPLQRELIHADDTRQLLRTEIRAATT